MEKISQMPVLFIPIGCRLASGLPKGSIKAQTFFLLDSTQISPQLSLGGSCHSFGYHKPVASLGRGQC